MTFSSMHGMGEDGSMLPKYAYAIALILAGVVGVSAVIYFSGWRYADMPVAAPSFRAGCVGRFLLAAAAVAYALRWRDLRQASEAAGSGMAAVAAIALVFSAILRRFESGANGLSVNAYGDAFYDPIVGFLVLTITAYLVMEWWYRDRSAGVWVMPVAATVATALEFQLVHMMQGNAVAVLRGYWHSTAVLLSVVGYVLLGFGCLLAMTCLARHDRGSGVRPAARWLRALSSPRLESLMVRSNLGGFALLVIAACVWEAWAGVTLRAQGIGSPIEPWVLATAFAYGGHFFLWRALRPALVHTAFWVASIYLSSLVAFVGINLGVA